jgi:Ras-related protein Rab-1A
VYQKKTNALDSDSFYKIILVGDFGIGKTSLLLRFTDGGFSEQTASTIGTDYVRTTSQTNLR